MDGLPPLVGASHRLVGGLAAQLMVAERQHQCPHQLRVGAAVEVLEGAGNQRDQRLLDGGVPLHPPRRRRSGLVGSIVHPVQKGSSTVHGGACPHRSA